MTGCRPSSEESCSRDPVITSSARTAIVATHTTAGGPNSRRRHGPRRAREEMAVLNSATEATTLTKGTEKRHHGRRLARNVDTGTVAAMVAIRRVTPRSWWRWAPVPHPRFQSTAAIRYSATWSRTHP